MTVGGQLFRFAAVGGLNTAVGLSAIWALMLAGLPPLAANALGFCAGLIVSFTLNRQWTFASSAVTRRQTVRQAARFGLTFLIAWTLNATVLVTGLRFTSASPYALQVVSNVVYSIVFFILCRAFVFRKTA